MERKTKRQIQQEQQRKALRQRVHDIVVGALGGQPEEDLDFYADELSRIVPALRSTFDAACEKSYLWDVRNLDRLANVDSITEFLFGTGIRG